MADTRALVDRFRTDIYPHIAEGPAVTSGPTPLNLSSARSSPSAKTSITRNRAILIDPVFQAFRKQRGLAAICSLNEAYRFLGKSRRNHNPRITSLSAFLHNQDPQETLQPNAEPPAFPV